MHSESEFQSQYYLVRSLPTVSYAETLSLKVNLWGSSSSCYQLIGSGPDTGEVNTFDHLVAREKGHVFIFMVRTGEVRVLRPSCCHCKSGYLSFKYLVRVLKRGFTVTQRNIRKWSRFLFQIMVSGRSKWLILIPIARGVTSKTKITWSRGAEICRRWLGNLP